MKWLLLFAGGGAGAILRYALGLWVAARTPPAWPWGTLAVNVAGCFAIGVVATLADEHAWVGPGARLLLVSGLLGGFTTFSTFGLETWELVTDGHAVGAAANVLASIAAGLAAVFAGVWITRQLV